jgi:hypothetical protein
MQPRLSCLAMAAAALVAITTLPLAALAVTDTEIRQAEDALQASPRDSVKRVEVAKLHYLSGSDYSMHGNAAPAAVEFKIALKVLEDKQSRIPQQHPVYEEVRYGLAYSDLALGQPQDAVVLLDQLVASSPRFSRARVLLGVALLRTASDTDTPRGLEVLAQVAKELPGPDGTMATHIASRYSYDLAVSEAAAGKPNAAAGMVEDLRDRFGLNGGATAAENQTFLYGFGTLELQAGNTAAGLAAYDGLKNQNPEFRLANGVTLRQVLANTYYRVGLDELSKGGAGASERAIAAFDDAEQYGSSKDADTHHGKALAYKQLDERDRMAVELALVLQADSSYYKRINTGS